MRIHAVQIYQSKRRFIPLFSLKIPSLNGPTSGEVVLRSKLVHGSRRVQFLVALVDLSHSEFSVVFFETRVNAD